MQQSPGGRTYSKLRVNGLVGDKVGNVLDLGVVFSGTGSHVGRAGQSSSRSGKGVAGGRKRAGDAKGADGGRADGSGARQNASRLETQLLGGGTQATVDSGHDAVNQLIWRDGEEDGRAEIEGG